MEELVAKRARHLALNTQLGAAVLTAEPRCARRRKRECDGGHRLSTRRRE